MKTKKKQRSQAKAVRWSLALAGTEFGLSPKTVATRVAAAGILPGEDGLFSTADMHAAICGDLEKEKILNLQKLNRDLDVEHAKKVGELVDREDLVKRLEPICVSMKMRVMGSKLSDEEKDALCKDMAELLSK